MTGSLQKSAAPDSDLPSREANQPFKSKSLMEISAATPAMSRGVAKNEPRGNNQLGAGEFPIIKK